MTKTLALIAALGLVAAPAFAAEAVKDAAKPAAVATDKMVKEGEKAAEAAPAAGMEKKDEKKVEEKAAH